MIVYTPPIRLYSTPETTLVQIEQERNFMASVQGQEMNPMDPNCIIEEDF